MDAKAPNEHVDPYLYHFYKDWWHSMQDTIDKGPIRHLKKYILEYDKIIIIT